MRWFTALILTAICFTSQNSLAQETVQEWSKKVIELQSKEGQNFEQDLQLVKGYLYLQRRAEALVLLNRLLKLNYKKDSRLAELFETASDQFFLQDTAELYADAIQFIKVESWLEAKEKIDAAIQKESKHRLLTLRAIQLGLILGQTEQVAENAKAAELNFPDFPIWRAYSAWINISKNELKEASRILMLLWNSDQKLFEKSEVLVLSFLQSLEVKKYSVSLVKLSKIIQNHPEWVAVRVWRLKNKSWSVSDRKREITLLKEMLSDLKKLNLQREKEEKESSYFFKGFISIEKTRAQFEELVK